MIAAGLDWANSIMTKRSWSEDFLRQWEDIETAAEIVGCKDKLHIWHESRVKKICR